MSNTNSRIEFVLSTDGKILKRSITETEKEVTPEMLSQLAAQESFQLPRLFDYPSVGMVDASVTRNAVYLTAKLESIRIKTNYTLKDGVLMPVFSDESEPVFDLRWTRPEDMTVLFIADLQREDNAVRTAAYLLAIDKEKRCYRLPLANIFDAGGICLGDEFPVRHPNHMAAFDAAYKQFDTSYWNADLDQKPHWAQKMFRFAPNGDSFKQLEPVGNWRKSCTIIAPPVLNFIKV